MLEIGLWQPLCLDALWQMFLLVGLRAVTKAQKDRWVRWQTVTSMIEHTQWMGYKHKATEEECIQSELNKTHKRLKIESIITF